MKPICTRRKILQGLLALAGMALMPLQLFARNGAAFNATGADEAMRALFGDKSVTASEKVRLKAPDIAENGAVVPVTVTADIEGVQSISLVVVENPNPLSARFNLAPGGVPDISTRIKMGKSSEVIAAVETQSGVYTASTDIKVTIGGCGG
ncbi:MAG: thiosulfate oxidation carrier protein SoxY [Halieaceae bacterium]|jgi:sulfur-oxidizing protein SoxY|nr:thiosulfate oxidation carrier protein SoxY [Halieaceae bacterium]